MCSSDLLDTLKRIVKIIRESAFDKRRKNSGLKFNPRLALTGLRTTGPRPFSPGFLFANLAYQAAPRVSAF